MASFNESHELEAVGDQSPDATDGLHVVHEYALTKSQQSREERDRAMLMRLGKNPVLKREFGLASIVGFTCTVLITWEGLLITLDIGLTNGGPSGILYGFVIVWFGTWCVYGSLCELASMAPTSGGQYFWVSMLAPPSTQKYLSYVTGWLTFTGWQALVASTAYLSGTLIQGLAVLTNPSYSPTKWQGTLLFWAMLVFAVLIDATARKILPRFEGAILILHIVGYFAVLIPVVVLGPHEDSSVVFSSFLNEGGWPTQGLSFMIGIIMSVFCFTGVDGAIHMCEEIKNASIIVPKSVMISVGINGTLAFTMLIAVFYCIGSLDDALNTSTDYPFMEIFVQATNSVAGAAIMASIITIMQICAVVANLASASRMYWSFSRDRAVPGWSFFVKVNKRTTIPLRCVFLTVTISFLLSLISFGSSTAFNDVVSLVIAGLYGSYLLAASLLLYRRCTGKIKPYGYYTDDHPVNNIGRDLMWGPWRMPGYLGIAANAYACVHMVVMIFFSLWPPEQPIDAENMNYSCLVTGAVIIFATFYYVVKGRKEYTGPIIETGSSRPT